MGIEDLFLVIILVAGFAFSGLQKLAQRMRSNQQPGEYPAEDESDSIRTARRRSAAGRPEAAQPANIEDVIRRLMGVETQPFEGPSAGNPETSADDWTPLSPPPIRRAPPPAPQPRMPAQRAPATPPRKMYQQPARRQAQMPQRPATPPPSARPVRQRPALTPQQMLSGSRPALRGSEDLLPEELEQRENERRWHEEMERRKKAKAAQEAQRPKQRTPEVLHTRARLMPARRRLFHSAGEVRRAIILSEVLAPPRATRDIEDRG